MTRYCLECHSKPPVQAAPFPLTGYAEVVDTAQRSLIQLQISNMPPFPRPRPGAAELALFEQWIDAGYPEGGACTFDGGSADGG